MKGNVGIEFTAAIGMAMLFLIIFAIAMAGQEDLVKRQLEGVEADKKAFEIAQAIQKVSENPGLTISFDLQQKLQTGNDMQIQVTNSSIYLISERINATSPFYTANVTNSSGQENFYINGPKTLNVTGKEYGQVEIK